jgi:hypothetical protein
MQNLQDAVSTGRKVLVIHTIALAVVFASLLGVVSYVRQRRRTIYGRCNAAVETSASESSCDDLKIAPIDIHVTKSSNEHTNGLFPVDWSELKDVKLGWNK